MIPKRAIFYWSGAEPTPLRSLSWESFAALNPSWEILMLGEPGTVASYRETVVKSDLLRYKALYEHGGYYFDTDIVFRKPIPDSWLNHDNACVLLQEGCAQGVAILGAKQGSSLWGSVYGIAQARSECPIMLDCQALGIKLLHNLDGYPTDLRAYAAKMGEGVFGVPSSAFFPFGACNVEMLWSPGYRPLTSECLGVHWFGGDRLSQEMEALPELPDCLVKSAMDEAMSLTK